MIFLDLVKQYTLLQREIDAAIKKVCLNGQFIMGEEVSSLEAELARYHDAKYAIGLGSGTDALHLALRALDIGPGDEVITTPFTMIATAEVITRVGAKPVFADIDPRTFNLDPDKVIKKLTKRTKAIIPVHLFGHSADMDALQLLAKKYKLKIIEDVCQSTGALWRGKKLGGIGDVGCLSFFPSKNLGGFGDGGMIVTNNKRIAERISLLRAHGARKKYHHEVLGVNSRLDSIQAAILRVKLNYLDSWNSLRRKKAQAYDKAFANIEGITVPYVDERAYHTYHQYTVRVTKQKTFRAFLAEKGIATMHYYPVPLHVQKAFAFLKYKSGDLPIAEQACKEVVSLKIDPHMPDSEQQHIIRTVKEFYATQ